MAKTIMQDTLIFGNSESEVGVITLWTKKEHISNDLPKEDYCILGNLFSRSQGISTIIRNCLQHKTIRYLIVCGVDMNQSGEALLSLAENGVTDQHMIVGFEQSIIDKALPIEAINRFRDNVAIIDCRGKKPEDIHEIIIGLEKKGSYGEPETFPHAQAQVNSFPTDLSGFKIKAYDVKTLKKRALYTLLRFGVEHDGNREVLNMMVVLIPEKETPYENKIYLWDGSNLVSSADSDEHVEFVDLGDDLYVISHVVSLDLFHYLEERMRSLHAAAFAYAKEHGKKVQSITLSAEHAYCPVQANTLVSESLPQGPPTLKRISDPRGNLVITLEEDVIKINHLDVHGNLLDTFFGNTAQELYKKMAREQTISELNHAFDIGCELQKAEIALKQGLKYVQDRELRFN